MSTPKFFESRNLKVFILDGRIDQSAAASFATAEKFDVIMVNSRGGEGLAAIDIANLMVQHKTVLKIKGYCMSACAEFLIPAASRVVAIGDPVIAVHGNPILLEQLYIETGAAMPDQCALQQIGLKAIYRKMGRSTALALAQRENLVLKSFKTKFNETTLCTDYAWEFSNSNWMPTRSDYLNLMGIDIEGGLCADSEDCISRKIASPAGRRKCKVRNKVINCKH